MVPLFPASGAQATGAGATAGSIAVRGSGFGHGVGLSQYGAYGQARANAALTGAQIARYYYRGSAVSSYPDNVRLKVNVAHARSSMTIRSTSVGTGGGGFTVGVSGVASRWVPAGQYVTVGRTSAGMVLVIHAPGVSDIAMRGASASLDWSQRPTTLDVTTSGTKHYRWGSLALARMGSAFEGLLNIDLHSYLKGVAEMPSSWPRGALEAQAVVSRTYALHAYRAGTRSACGGCHLYDSTMSQVYAGWSKESQPTYGRLWLAAVGATQTGPGTGQTVLYGGTPVDAFFFSSSGGRTRNSEDVWSAALPYARSVPDPWSLNRTVNPSFALWSRSASVPALLRLFDLPDLYSVRVSARDAGGAVRTVTALAANGAARSVTGDRFRTTFGLPSSWVTSLGALPVTNPGARSRSVVTNMPSATSVLKAQWFTERGSLTLVGGSPQRGQRVSVSYTPAGQTRSSFAGTALTSSTGSWSLRVRAWHTGSWFVSYPGSASSTPAYKGVWVKVS